MRALLVCLTAGCYVPVSGLGSACETDCPGDLVCIGHVCRTPGTVVDAPPPPPVDVAIDGPPTDLDNDGVPNNADNCPTKANVDQHDEDNDMFGDACDPCPHVPGTLADGDGDGVGDACDPQPQIAKQTIAFFDPFTSQRPEWMAGSAFAFGNDALRIAVTASQGGATLVVPANNTRIVTAGRITAVGSTLPRQVLIAFGAGTTTDSHYIQIYDNGAPGSIDIVHRIDMNYPVIDSAQLPGSLPTGAFAFHLDVSATNKTIQLAPAVGGVAYTPIGGVAPAFAAGTAIGFYATKVDITYDYFLVIETMP